MIRSCYSTVARFYEGDSTQEPIKWFFTLPDAPFLPINSCINSLNWVERRGLTDEGHAGEVPGASRSYSKGERDISLTADQYCGTDLDWLGLGTRPSDPIPLNMFGNPACCNPQTFGLNVTCKVFCTLWFSNLILPVVVAYTLTGDEGAFNAVYGFWNGAAAFWPYNVDLYYAYDSSKPYGDISAYSITEFPGYATQMIYPGPANQDSEFGLGQYIDNGLSWYMDSPMVFNPKMWVIGILITDPAGGVVAIAPLVDPVFFAHAGDQLGILIRAYCLEDF